MNWSNFNFWVYEIIWWSWLIFWIAMVLQIIYSQACPNDKVLWLILTSLGFMYTTLHKSEGFK